MKTRALFAALCLAAMLLAQGTANAIELVFTENSSTSLAATFDGQALTVNNLANDFWVVQLPGGFLSADPAQWTEPENSSLVNRAAVSGLGTSIDITSDVTAVGGTPVADGTRVSFGTLREGRHVADVFATFFDKAASAEGGTSVPDAGSTATLLGLALLGIEGLRRQFRTA
jgi:hypothetical protein